MQAHRSVESGLPALARPDGLGEQRVQLPDIERVTARKIIGKVEEPLRYAEVRQGLAALRALDTQHLAPLR